MPQEKQTTAVQTLANFLNEHCNPSVCDIDYADFKLAILNALDIERQQIENACDNGISSVLKNFDKAYSEIDGSDYFESTFTQQNNLKIIEEFPNEFGKINDIPSKLGVIIPIIGSEKESIRDEMDSDMENSGMAQGEIESCLNHWFNKYNITRK